MPDAEAFPPLSANERGEPEPIHAELANYSEFWQKKIRRNIERDEEVNDYLKSNGWRVLRFWESDIKKDSISCAKTVYQVVKNDKSL